ncbi:MAG: 2-oxoglutarate dehydrogenase E1 component, partial [Flavobacteriales bacterium]
CTTPANFFHLLRRQVKSDYRKPLVVFTPKKLLRYPKAVSALEDLATGSFREVLDEPGIQAKNTEVLVFCSGKVYYDILEEKEKQGVTDQMAVVRVEQLYPLPESQIRAMLNRYASASRVIWCQEEPENMGAWTYLLRSGAGRDMEVVSLPASASPATGSPKLHEHRTRTMMNKLFEHIKVNA